MRIKNLKNTWSTGLLVLSVIIIAVGISYSSTSYAGEVLQKPTPPTVVSGSSALPAMPLKGYQFYHEPQIFLGTTLPASFPFIYTFTTTDTTGTWTTTATVSCFQKQFVSNIFPTGTVTGTPTFSWTGISDSSAIYGVELNDNSGNRIWDNHNIYGTSTVYSGPTLIPGMNYNYLVLVESSSTCSNQGSSFVLGNFIYQ